MVAKELQAFYPVFRAATTYNFLSSKDVLSLPLSQLYGWNPAYRLSDIDPQEQWIWDTKVWFESSFILFRVYLQSVITGERTRRFWVDKVMDDELREKVCGHVLFLDSNYTNIDFFGLMVTLAAILIISAASHAEQLENARKYINRFSRQGFRVFQSTLMEYWMNQVLYFSTFLIRSEPHPQSSQTHDVDLELALP